MLDVYLVLFLCLFVSILALPLASVKSVTIRTQDWN
jgi:hypothetical protein